MLLGDFRDILIREFESRADRNPRYSLRAFAKHLRMDAPTLSRVFNEKKKPGIRLIKRLSTILELSPKTRDSVIYSQFPNERLKQKKTEPFDFMEEDRYQIVSKWYYFAILELIKIDTLDHSPKGIASHLGLKKNVAKIAIERLKKCGMIKEKEGKLIDLTTGKTTILGEVKTSEKRKRHQKDLLNLAIDSIDLVNISLRDHTSITVAINQKDIEQAKSLIRDFHTKLGSFLASSPVKDAVYNVSISLYPLTKQEKK